MTTYYADFVAGLDAAPGDGSSAHPWKTINKFFTSCANGDTCKLRGSPAAPHREMGISTVKTGLTVEADAGHTPVIYASTEFTAWALTGGTVKVYQTAYAPGAVYGVWNGTTRLSSTASVVACEALDNSFYFNDAGNLLHVNIGGGAPTSIEVVNTFTPAIVQLGTGGTIRSINFRYSGRTGFATYAANQTIANCYFSCWSVPFSGLGPIVIGSGGWLVDTCTFTLLGSEYPFALIAGSSGATITNCISSTSWGPDIVAGSGHTIRNTSITVTSNKPVYVHGTATAVTLDGCVITGGTHGIYLESGINHIIANCTVSGSSADGLSVRAGVTATISNTTVYDSVHVNFFVVGAGAAATLHHCIAYATHDVGQSYGFVAESGGAATLYHCIAAYNSRCTGLIRAAVYVLGGGSTAVVRNCIAYSCGGGYILEASGTSLNVDYSLGGCVGCVPGGHMVAGNPLFVNEMAYSEDFHLLAGSPCIDAGVVIAGINDGTGGSTHWLGAAPDIGRYEMDAPGAGGWLMSGPMGSQLYSWVL